MWPEFELGFPSSYIYDTIQTVRGLRLRKSHDLLFNITEALLMDTFFFSPALAKNDLQKDDSCTECGGKQCCNPNTWFVVHVSL